MNKKLIIRADADTRMGTGHVLRCIALAQVWQDQGGDVTFLSHCGREALHQRIINEGFDSIPIEKPHPDSSDLTQTLNILKRHAPCLPRGTRRPFHWGSMPHALWFVVDGYHFTPDYQKAIRENGYRLLVIDDAAHLDHYHADILLNQNSHASSLNYSCDGDTAKLLGCEYVLLRREFLKWRSWNRKISAQARKILVTLGGGDPENVTAKVVEAVGQIKLAGLEVIVVTGSNNPNFAVLQNLIRNDTSDMRLRQNVADMSELLAWSDVAVSAGGSTCWELAYMGLPAVVMVLAENQKDIAADLDRAGVVISLKQHTEVTVEHLAGTIFRLIEDHKLRQKMSRRGRELVDGQGSVRVVQKLLADTQGDLGRNSLCA
jgi:UDP-2,4-diacetamido-2,4,6-trideoxy-beta-L-altropyranose hydrolase